MAGCCRMHTLLAVILHLLLQAAAAFPPAAPRVSFIVGRDNYCCCAASADSSWRTHLGSAARSSAMPSIRFRPIPLFFKLFVAPPRYLFAAPRLRRQLLLRRLAAIAVNRSRAHLQRELAAPCLHAFHTSQRHHALCGSAVVGRLTFGSFFLSSTMVRRLPGGCFKVVIFCCSSFRVGLLRA